MYDLAIIGLGSAGLEALQIALKNNLNVVVFEPNKLGGTCLNLGCIPTKSILHCANLYNKIKTSSSCGIELNQDVLFDWQKIIERKNNIVSKFNKALDLAYSKKVEIVKDYVEIKVDNNVVKLISNNKEFLAKNIIIATGSKPFELSNMPFDNKFILNSDDMFELDKLPKTIAIIGSGAIGLEWAQILSSLDVETTIIEKAPNLAPNMDIDIQKRLDRILKQKNIKFYKNDYVVKINENKLILNSGDEVVVEKVLVAVGRKNVLPKCNKEITINSDYSTNLDNTYVIGDASKDIMLAHSASYQARKVMDKILFNKEIKKSIVPSVIYITPEIASVGLKEQDIKNINDYKIAKFMIPSLAKSWCDEANDGFIKVIFKDDIIVGSHIVSKNACELISTFSVLINQKVKKDEILDMILPHPSYAEAILEIVKNA